MQDNAMIGLRVGGSFNPKWTEQEPGLAGAYAAIERMRGVVRGVVDTANKLKQMPVEHRTLSMDRLAKSGQAALESIKKASEAGSVFDAIEETHGKRVRDDLMTVNGATQSQFAASQVRDYVRTLPAKARREALREALGDVEAVRAILGAPPMASGLKMDEWQAFKQQAEHQFLPDVFEARRVVGLARKEFERARKNAEALVAEAAGLKYSERGKGYVPVWEVEG